MFWGGTHRSALRGPHNISYRGVCSGGGGGDFGPHPKNRTKECTLNSRSKNPQTLTKLNQLEEDVSDVTPAAVLYKPWLGNINPQLWLINLIR